jgi:hypothetical protein
MMPASEQSDLLLITEIVTYGTVRGTSPLVITAQRGGVDGSRASTWAMKQELANTLIKTTVRNKYLFVLDFIVHYYNMFRPRSVAIFR